ncbi:hypothetical protein LCGC14_2118930 [marine sediment metagenome]|uniref:Uncharacterized protein n=1 Tax=marine sediment metagenome TaxID=412755 RepID=A0A0F9ERX7_9ZZZZ
MEFVTLAADHIPKMHHLIGKLMLVSDGGLVSVPVAAMEEWLRNGLEDESLFGAIALDPEPIAYLVCELIEDPRGQSIHIIHWYTEKSGIGTMLLKRIIEFGVCTCAIAVVGVISTKSGVEAARRAGATVVGLGMSLDLSTVQNSNAVDEEEK